MVTCCRSTPRRPSTSTPPTPSFDSSASFTEDGAAAVLAPNAAVADADAGDQIESATVTLTNRPDGAAESLAVTLSGGISAGAGYDSGTGVLTLTGAATPAQYETVLQTVRYTNSSQAPTTAARLVTFTVNDGQADSATRTATVTVTAVNDAPAIDLDSHPGRHRVEPPRSPRTAPRPRWRPTRRSPTSTARAWPRPRSR